uniref:CSON008359 protein n=2 Tax=Culicoides sonorensis TaxID=179676 RepID=A0A336M2C2_CULSO
MLGFNRKYCEVVTEQPIVEHWREIVLDTGALQSTLQDVKVPENAGGYLYKNIGCDAARNRFIYWRANHDILELSEQSLDINLRQNHLRFKFTATAILSVQIFETFDSITVLAATITSVHRFDFPHPNQLIGKGRSSQVSIFSPGDNSNGESTPGGAFKYHIIVQSSGGHIPHAASVYLSPIDHLAYFALAFNHTTIVYQMQPNGITTNMEMKASPMIPRIFSNLTGVFRGKNNQEDGNSGTSLVFDQFDDQIVLFILHRDCNIRMWSIKTGQSLTSLSILMVVQKNLLRKSPNGLSVFLCYSNYSEFRLLKPVKDGSNYTITLTNIIPTPQYDIIDFQLTEHRIWTLWCNSEGDSNISTFPLNLNTMTNWISTALEPYGNQLSPDIESGRDPKQVYSNYIFHSGRFQTYTIFKALMMYCRTHNYMDPYIPMNVLKERVCFAIDQDVQNEIETCNLSNRDYLEISSRLWEKFYFCCEQYHMEANQPIGIFNMDSIDMLGVIKKNVLSFLRPCENLENGLLTGTLPLEPVKHNRKELDIERLLDVLSYIEKVLPEAYKTEFGKKLYRADNPLTAIQQILVELQDGDWAINDTVSELLRRVQVIHDMPSAIINLLEALRYNPPNQSVSEPQLNIRNAIYKFGSAIGTSLLTETVRQVSLVRYTLCRNLLLLEQVLTENSTLNVSSTEVIRSRCIPDTTVFLQGYYVMVWISEPNTITTPRRKFTKNTISIVGLPFQHPSPLLLYLIREKGLQMALELDNAMKEQRDFDHDLLNIAHNVLLLLWPISGSFDFGEWLSETCQHTLIEEYVRLLKTWCEWNTCSRNFILALSFLHNGLSDRALDLFLQSAKGVLEEPFLTKYILQSTQSSLSSSDALSQYYLKVIKLFERHALYDNIISIAQVAIGASDKANHHAMFQSILFNNHMYLNHYEEAYHTLINNCEANRRKDCLRQLICALIAQKRFDILLQLPLIDLEEEVQNIIETRARSMQVDNPLTLCHYDFLYSFHIRKEKMRSAAVTMYEKAMRCTQLPSLQESLEFRYDSLLACINALNLIDKEYAFIAKPVLDDYFDSNNVKDLKEVVVVDLNDLHKELLVTEAMIVVEKYKKNVKSLISTGPTELVELLNIEKCYTNSFKLAKGLKLDLTSIFDSLTLACLQIDPNSGCDWLNRNVLTHILIGRDDTTTAWNFLQHHLNEEVETCPKYYKVVTRQILVNHAHLPLWLYKSYKNTNLSELMHLFIQYGRLDEAFDVAIDCIQILITKATVKNRPECKNAYFPLNNIDLLLHVSSKYTNKNDSIKEKSDKLNQLLGRYVNGVLVDHYIPFDLQQSTFDTVADPREILPFVFLKVSTGYVRPGIVKTGTFPKNVANFVASIVAEVTMSFKSCLRATISRNNPNNTSVDSERS